MLRHLFFSLFFLTIINPIAKSAARERPDSLLDTGAFVLERTPPPNVPVGINLTSPAMRPKVSNDLPEREFSFGKQTYSTASSMVECEVWRDYYYDHDTGEFLGWAGDPYVKNCTSIGGGDGNGPSCLPGDMTCLCQQGNKHPLCEGGGGGDFDCPKGATKRVGASLKAGDQCDKPNKPKVTCNQCRKNYQKSMQRVAELTKQCVSSWAKHTAAAKCEAGILLGGFYSEYLATHDPIFCVSVPALGESGKFHVRCQETVSYKQCVNAWMNGTNKTSVEYPPKDAVVTVTSDLFEVEVPFGLNAGETTEVDRIQGLAGLCSDMHQPNGIKALKDFEACSKTAADAAHGTCKL